MLERVALHQTRLRAPGLSLDARGIALGERGLVLFGSLDRLVAFVAVYTENQTLDDLAQGLRIELLRSKLGAREVALSFRAESSDRMDGVAQVARLAGGDTFSGGGRHWVQYRDAAAPFGYDVAEVAQSSAAVLLYHQSYVQAFEVEREIDLKALLLRLVPRVDPRAGRGEGPRWLLAEWGLGRALLHYVRRSGVAARAGVVEWPPASELEDEPVRRYLVDVPALPGRMTTLFAATPGIRVFQPVAPGAAVEVGYRHPVVLRAVPFFRGPGLTLFRAGDSPLELATLPPLGDVDALVRIELGAEPPPDPVSGGGEPPTLRVPLKLVPSLTPWRNVTAAWVPVDQFALLRRLLYVLSPETLRRATIAVTPEGAFLRVPRGIDALPLGEFFRALGPSLYVPAGYDTLPAVGVEALTEAVDAPGESVVVLRRGGPAWSIEERAFVNLETASVEGHTWAPLGALAIDDTLARALPELTLSVESLGVNPLADVKR